MLVTEYKVLIILFSKKVFPDTE